MRWYALALVGLAARAEAFAPAQQHGASRRIATRAEPAADDVVSPFESDGSKDDDDDEILPLTYDNVEKILDEMRPYLMSDGGNVRIAEIDGPVAAKPAEDFNRVVTFPGLKGGVEML